MNYYAWYPESNAHFFQAMPPSYYPYYGKRPMMMQSMFSKKKSPSGPPRPEITVLPRSIGPIYHPSENDVLAGRGGRINSHIGNVRFRKLVAMHKADYISKSTKKFEKAHIAASIVQHIRHLNPPGRFLKEDPDGSWFEIGDHKAIKKVGQALREDAPDVREELESSSKKSDDKSCQQHEKGAVKQEGNTPKSCQPIVVTIRRPSLREESTESPSYSTKMEQLGGTEKSRSAAATAALEGSGEIAFGRVFYPPPTLDDMEISTTKDASLISGLSSHLTCSILDQRQQPYRQHTYSAEYMSRASFQAPSSVASMSINSGSVSFPASILSDLSETFTAMDIGEPLPIDSLL
ncbi:hypothetical protein FisN_8Hh119 [Fistulifera solaris]|uniref:DUF6824 domain-containing protein n=1 Tax=Fistulifera solaris TaxID=1519565 RepID=A0A1Z5JYS3_FISSO|nr:hypothetical protein FisN_8Hh119 [Fistulifera solaris]|eukprot:GAX18901.1 hypothetical protein FisN_8Hh119 [Fistulifera solaris]